VAGRWVLAGAMAIAAILFGVAIDGWSGLLIGTVALGAGGVAAKLLSGRGEQSGASAGHQSAQPGNAGMQEALETAPLAALLLARDTTILFANREARRLFPSLRTGDPLSLRLRVPEVLDAVAATLRDHVAQGTDFSERRPVERSFHARTFPLTAESGKAPALAVFLEDASGLRRVEAMRSDFVANASHELRTPLASILGFIETLQGPARRDAEAQQKFLAIMADQARRMARLVDDLLSLSRIQLKEHIPPTARVDVRGVVEQIADALSGLARERGVTVAIMASGPAVVAGDRDDLLRVFDNLIENAIKYGRSGGKVDVSIEDEAATPDIVIRVRDYGPGIDPQHLPRLTERFYRVDTTVSRAEGGTGLGLALVKHIVNRHRGRLDIDSEPGMGATFSVSLPRPK